MLYWYRTPPGVRMGRRPFDLDVQKLIEQQNPGLTFDWETIVNTPMPPPDMTEYWRERRRQEKAARQERRASEAAESDDGEPVAADAEAPEPAVSDVSEELEPQDAVSGDLQAESAVDPQADSQAESAPDGSAGGEAPRKRRRRRGGRRRRGEGGGEAGQSLQEGAAATPDADVDADPSGTDEPTSKGE